MQCICEQQDFKKKPQSVHVRVCVCVSKEKQHQWTKWGEQRMDTAIVVADTMKWTYEFFHDYALQYFRVHLEWAKMRSLLYCENCTFIVCKCKRFMFLLSFVRTPIIRNAHLRTDNIAATTFFHIFPKYSLKTMEHHESSELIIKTYLFIFH